MLLIVFFFFLLFYTTQRAYMHALIDLISDRECTGLSFARCESNIQSCERICEFSDTPLKIESLSRGPARVVSHDTHDVPTHTCITQERRKERHHVTAAAFFTLLVLGSSKKVQSSVE